MEIKEKIGKALEDIDETSKRCPIWVGCVQYLRLDYVQRLLLELLDDNEDKTDERNAKRGN
jgi:menaquinone-dependent protoporphyrinogen IX oxidase